MADTNTTFLGLTKVEVGASGDTWGTKLNTNADTVDALFGTGPALLVTRGGTGAITAAAARTNLGVAIGTNVQAWDADLDAIAALAGTSGLLRKTAANTWSLETTAYAPLAAPTFTGVPAAPTAAVDTNTTQLATTAFVVAQASATTPVVDGTAAVGTSLRYARADHVHPSDTSRAALASPTFTGTPAAPTAAANTNTTQLATTAFVLGQGNTTAGTIAMNGTQAAGSSNLYARADHVHPSDTSRAPLASPTFTGTPTLPTGTIAVTQAADTNSTTVATTAYVVGQASSTAPVVNGTATVGTSLRYARADHVHPTDTSRAPLASPALTGTPTAPTATAGTNNTQIATTAFVLANTAPGTGRLLRAPQVLTSGTSYTTPAGCTAIYVEAVGGGGAGYGPTSAQATQGGGGGGAGAYCGKYFAVAPSTAYSYAIGAGGAGAVGTGSAGGSTTFTGPGPLTITAGGGAACTSGNASAAGGTATNGDINAPGGYSQQGSATVILPGMGGVSFFGGAGSGDAAGNGLAGTTGSGGGGGANAGSAANRTGGSGGAGLIRIWEFA